MSVNNGNGFAKGKAVDVEGAYEEYGDFNDIDRYVDLDLDDDFPEAPQVRTVGVKGNRASLEGAVLKFEKIMFVVGKGKREKIIVKGVSATVNHGRKFVSTNRTFQSFYNCMGVSLNSRIIRTINSSVDYPDVNLSALNRCLGYYGTLRCVLPCGHIRTLFTWLRISLPLSVLFPYSPPRGYC